MASTIFIPGTPIVSSWLNDVNTQVYKNAINIQMAPYGGVADDTTDLYPAVVAAIAALGPLGGTIYYPAGNYVTLSTLPDVENVYHVGAGINATTIRAGGDFPIFTRAGGPTTTINCGGIKDMDLQGYWNQNPAQRTNSAGIKTFGSNGARYSNIRFRRCYYAFWYAYTYESSCDNLYVLGAGTDQNYVGFVGEPATLANVNNAMFFSRCVGSFTYSSGWVIPNPNGSVIEGCTAEACGAYGFQIGNSSVQAVPCQFLNMINCLGDSCVLSNYAISGHATQKATRMLFSNNWSGLTGGHNWEIVNTDQVTFTGNNGISAAKSALRLSNSPINVTGFVGNNYNSTNAGFNGVDVADTDGVVLVGNTLFTGFTASGGKGIVESGTTNNSVITSNHMNTGAIIIGAQSKVRDNFGFTTESQGTTTIVTGATTIDINHNLGITPTLGEISVKTNLPISVGISGITGVKFTVTIPVQVVDTAIGWSAAIIR